jgi:hypothetical protein
VPDGFVALEALLRATPAPLPAGVEDGRRMSRASAASVSAASASDVGTPASEPHCACSCGAEQVRLVTEELMLARLAALETFERVAPRLLEGLARDVLGRELALARPDIAALARSLVDEFATDEPVALVIAAEDATQFEQGLPLRIDPRLRAGDLVLEVRDGEIDARFGVRLRAALSAALPEGTA